ncbi:thioredoxin fold domain-containing protein [Thiorhodococcus mannitoliphagus]|uniref:Thioredoxin fold domain-containing protein n=1 Tax=Thiorhodococcus mannitoliphagus TaxID=329406 RepID=A0A6P1DXU6_9GAMM|nr:thioredoxin family protein [Thiorhodococcus mannitoliphagus]NEX22519.1 thioredoxin fold domain-containing protein [Thiorhodococcus mannitoliphagus]
MRSNRSWRPQPKLALASSWLLAAAVTLWVSSALGVTRDPVEHFFNTTFGDFSEELETARAEGKQGVLLMFEMDECPFCHRMKTTVLNQSEVQDYFQEHFLIFPVDIEGDIEITDFSGDSMKQKDFALKTHRVRATPVFAFFDLDGNMVARYTGAARDAAEFMLLGTYVVEGHYKDMSFPQYKRERRETAKK